MNCAKCNILNDAENLFCVNCGETLKPSGKPENADLPATQIYPPIVPNERDDSPDSIPTALRSPAQFVPPTQTFNPAISTPTAQPIEPSNNKFIWFGVITLLLLIGGGVIGAFFFINKQSESAEVLPDHLGMFVQNREKNGVSEISKQDFTDALQAKDDLLKSESLLNVEGKPNMILYADGKDIPLSDLKLIQLDTIKDDGNLKHIDYQAAPVEGKPEMKRLRVPDGLANGKYAFALFDGFLDDGKHKFWAFQVKNTEKSDNGDLAKEMTLSLKPTPLPTPTAVKTQNVPSAPPKLKSPPPSDEIAYCRTNNVVLRSAPSLSASKVTGLNRGQKVYIINYSDNYDTWRGTTANWAYVATDNGQRGWVFTPLIRY